MTCAAIIEIIKRGLEHQLVADNLGAAVGLPGLRQDASVLVSVTSQVNAAYHQSWRKAQAVQTLCGKLFTPKDATSMSAEPKELAAARTLKVNEPDGDQPPTITLGTWSMPPGSKEGYTYQVQWAPAEMWRLRQGGPDIGRENWPAAGTYVITELLEDTVQIVHLEDHTFVQTPEGQKAKAAEWSGKVLESTVGEPQGDKQRSRVARFVNPSEAFLTVEMREGGGKREKGMRSKNIPACNVNLFPTCGRLICMLD